uniref:Uncharacterized protein n=1 Tax=Tanacetum cinerariifolium TaxID=118510 RepID=A0A699H388_TANCI|nr:hypothetical protein [Tanacetum cinerariifolium]
MQNNIMVAGSSDRPPMLTTGRYAQWQSSFLRYIDTRPNDDALRQCILEGPYTPSTVIIPALSATDDSPEVLERTTVKTILNIDEIYSTVDACKTAHDMWMAIERLQHDSRTDTEPLEHVQYDVEYIVFANKRQHSEQPKSINNTCVMEKVNSNVISDSPDMCNNDIQTDQNAKEYDNELVALANLIANLKLDVDENKKILKQLKKENTSLAHELK